MTNCNLTAIHFRSLFALGYSIENTRLNYKIEKALNNGRDVTPMLDVASSPMHLVPQPKLKILEAPPSGTKTARINRQPLNTMAKTALAKPWNISAKKTATPIENIEDALPKTSKPSRKKKTKMLFEKIRAIARIRTVAAFDKVKIYTLPRFQAALAKSKKKSPASSQDIISSLVPLRKQSAQKETGQPQLDDADPGETASPIAVAPVQSAEKSGGSPIYAKIRKQPRADQAKLGRPPSPPISVETDDKPVIVSAIRKKRQAPLPPESGGYPYTPPSIPRQIRDPQNKDQAGGPAQSAEEQEASPIYETIPPQPCVGPAKPKKAPSPTVGIESTGHSEKSVAVDMPSVRITVSPSRPSVAAKNAIKFHMQCATEGEFNAEENQLFTGLANIAFCKLEARRSSAVNEILFQFEKSPSDPALHREIASCILQTCHAAIKTARSEQQCAELPAGLLHLLAQYGDHERNNNVSPLLVPPEIEQKILSILAQAADLDINAQGIADPARFITTEELDRSCSKDPSSLPTFDLRSPGAEANIDDLIDRSFLKRGDIAMRPVFLDEHFMLLIAQHNLKNEKYDLMLVSTRMCTAETKSLIERNSELYNVMIFDAELQKNVVNSCGAMVSDLYKYIEKESRAGKLKTPKDTKAMIIALFSKWKGLSPVQQQFKIMATRSRMYANAVAATRNDSDKNGKPRADQFIPCTTQQWDAAPESIFKRGIRTLSGRQHRISGRTVA